MDRRRAAGVLLALAACFACSDAAPTAGNQTALDLYEGTAEGCYYNFQHYGEGDRIMTNEPCLNCTCHNRMLMCYLRVCPFTKPIGQDCTVEKRADQCCPIVTCPDVPVDLLTSTSTSSPAEYGATGLGKVDKYGCSIHGKYFPEGSKVPPTPNKPCEHCYCIRNMTTCVMQECTLHVDGCTPIYHKDVCCPVRYSCDHPEDEIPLLDDMSTTVRPTPGFLLTTTTVSPVTQMTQDCVHENQIFADGALIKTEKPCDHCYCMKGDIVCVVQECGTPMENEGKNCTSLPPREGQCCPDTYICEGDVVNTDGLIEPTTEILSEKHTTLSPPMRGGVEGSGYRNEHDEIPYTIAPTESAFEGSGDEHVISDINELVTTEEPSSIDEVVPTAVTDEYIKPTYEEPTKTSDINQILSGAPTDSPQYKTTTTLPKTEDFEKLTTSEITEEEILQPHDHLSTNVTVDDSYETATTEMSESLVTEFDDIKKHTIGLGSTSTSYQQESETTTLKPDISVNEAQVTTSHDLHTTIPNIEKLDGTKQDVSSTPKTPHATSSSVTGELGSTEYEVTSAPHEYEKMDTTDKYIKDIVTPTSETHVFSTVSTDVEKDTTQIDHAENTIAVAEEESTSSYAFTPSTSEKSILEAHDQEFTPGLDNGVIDNTTDSKAHTLVTVTEPVIEDIHYTTEVPDKGLNTIPNVIYEEVSSEPSVVESKPTEFTSLESSSKMPDVTKGDLYTVTTEPSFRKEDEIIVSTQKQKEISTVKPEFVDDGLIPTSVHDDKYNMGSEATYTEEDITTESKFHPTESYYPISTISENVPDRNIQSTGKPIYELPSSTEKIEDASTSIPVDIGSHEEPSLPSSTEKIEDASTSISVDIDTHEESSRIPGEGDCLLEGVTYRNNSIVPSSNNCHSGCKCVSSIIKCDPIICSPPPNYNGNCQTIYDSPDSCCPTYVCDHPRETVPPQSDNQMSATESPMSHPTIQCRGDQCEITTSEKQQPESNCGAEGCSSATQRPEQSKPTHQEPLECTGDKCGPSSNVCVGTDCQLPIAEDHHSPAQPCEGKDCNTQEHPASQGLQNSNQTPPCQGDSCVNKVDCGSSGCETSNISHPADAHDTPVDCNGELSCRRKETQPDSGYLPVKCEGADCNKETQSTIAQNAEASTLKPAEATEQQTYPEGYITTEKNKEVLTTVEVNIETTEKTDHQQESSTLKEESIAPTPDTSVTMLIDTEQENTVPVEESLKPIDSQITVEDHKTEIPTIEDKVTESPVTVSDEKEAKPADGDELSNTPIKTVEENTSDNILREKDHLSTTQPTLATNVPQSPAEVSEQSTTIPKEVEEQDTNIPPQVDIEGTQEPVLGDIEQQTSTVIDEKSTVEPVIVSENTESYVTVHSNTEKSTVTEAVHLEPTEIKVSDKPEEDVNKMPVTSEDQDQQKPATEESTDKLLSSSDEISTPKTIVDEIKTNDDLTPVGMGPQKPEIDEQKLQETADQGTKEKEKPSTTKEEENPDISEEENKPLLSKDDEKPVISEEKEKEKKEEKPDVAKENEKPVVSKEEEKPAITKEEVKPDISEEKEKPVITKEEEEKPVTIGQDEKPVTTKEEEKPGKPFITKEEEKPTKGEEKEKPAITKDEDIPEVNKKEEKPVSNKDEGSDESIEKPISEIPSTDHEQPTIGGIIEENVQTSTTDASVELDKDKIDERFEGNTELSSSPEVESTSKPGILESEGSTLPTESNNDANVTPTITRDKEPSLPSAEESTTPSPLVDENQDQKTTLSSETEPEKPLLTEIPVTGEVTEISSKVTTEKVMVEKTTQREILNEDVLATTTEKPNKVTVTTYEEDTENKYKPFTDQEITDIESTEEPSITEDKDDEKPVVDDLKKPILINEEDKGVTSVTETVPSAVSLSEKKEKIPTVSDTEIPVSIGAATDKPIEKDDETKETTTKYEKPGITENVIETDKHKLNDQLGEGTPLPPFKSTDSEIETPTITTEKPKEQETPEEGSGSEMQLPEDLSNPESTTGMSLESENKIPVQQTEVSSEITPHTSQFTTDSRKEVEAFTEDALQKTTESINKIDELETVTKQPDSLTSSHDEKSSTTKSPQAVTTTADRTEEDTSEKIYEIKTEQPQSEVTLGITMEDQATGYDSTSAKSVITTILPEMSDKPTTKSSELLEKPDKEVVRVPTDKDDVKYDHSEISTETEQKVTESTTSVVTKPVPSSAVVEDSNFTGYPEKSTESEPLVTEKFDQVSELVTSTPIITEYSPVSDTDREHITMTPNIEKETRKPLESSTTEASMITASQTQENLTEEYTPSEESATTVSSYVSLQTHSTTLTPEEKQKPVTEAPQQHITAVDDKNIITESEEIYTKKEEADPTVTQKISVDVSSTAIKEVTKVSEPITAQYTESYDLSTTESPAEKSTILDKIETATYSDHITSETPLSLVTDHEGKSTEQPHSATTLYYESTKHPETHVTEEPEKYEVPVAVTEFEQQPEIINHDEKITERPIKATPEELVTSSHDTQTDSRTDKPHTKLPEITTTKSAEDISKATEQEVQTQISETTPYLIELEEHTHKIEDDNLTPTSSEETTTQDEHISTISPLYIDHDQTARPSENEIEPIVTTVRATETEPASSTTALPSKPVEEDTLVTEEQGAHQDYTTSTTLKPLVVSEETTEITHPQHSVVYSDASTVAPEKVTSETDKPTQPFVHPENVAPEEEFIFATTKATTLKQEEEAPIQSLDDKFAKPDGKPETEEALHPASTAEATKPGDVQPTDEVPSPEEEGHFPPSGSGGYGEPDYAEEDQAFGPGTCRYGGKVYVSAQQIPRDDPCDFCFCFRSDIICLQQSCPPPIHGCHEEPIQGFCCPRYECPVSMATTVNVTTTTTTTTTTLPPHFLAHAYKGAAQRRGCQIKGHTYKVGEVVRSSSGPCLHCTCGGDGQMKCDPKACTPEPMLRQMIAAAVSAKRRR